MRRAKIEQQNEYLLIQQRRFRVAADVVTDAWMAFPEVHAVAVIGSVAKPLWKGDSKVQRIPPAAYRGLARCGDLDLALWIDSQHRLGELRRRRDRALREAFEAGADTSVAGHQVDVFLFEPHSDRYLGRLCSFSHCPNGKPDCMVPGCGATPFNKRLADFTPRPDLLASAGQTMLYERAKGLLRSALELPLVDEERPPPV